MSVRIAIPEPSIDTEYNQRALPPYIAALQSAGATAVLVPLHERPDRVAKLLATAHGVLLPGSRYDVDPQRYGAEPIAACGPADSARTAVDELLLQDAFNLHKPIFGICHGAQTLNVWRNGTLVQDLPSILGTAVNHSPGRDVVDAHPVAITAGTRLAAILASTKKSESKPRGADSLAKPATQWPGAKGNLREARGTQGAFSRGGHSSGDKDDSGPAEGSLDGQSPVNSSHHQAIATVGDNLRVAAVSPGDRVVEAVELDAPDQWVVAVQWHPERTYTASAFSRALFAAFIQAAATWQPRRVEESVSAR
jgi:putative glutamine amidotransferase